MARVWLAGALVVGLVACGGDDGGNDADPSFPDVAGVYEVVGVMPNLDPAADQLTGTIVLTQASTAAGTLEGEASLYVSRTPPEAPYHIPSAVTLASVSENGVVQFTVEWYAWRMEFTGTVDGTSMSGRYTVEFGEVREGTWSARRVSDVP